MLDNNFLSAFGVSQHNSDKYCQYLNDTMNRYNISSPEQQAHFISQILHESGNLQFSVELASGKAYEGRKDLGNINPGDGVKFKGRGLIQITGRSNYASYGTYLNRDLLTFPETLGEPELAADSAGWFWAIHRPELLELSKDKNNIEKITRKINGGLNGLDDRLAKFQIACNLLGIK